MAEYSASNIQVLEGLEAVRKRPGMYVGSTGPRGLEHLVYELVSNTVDRFLAGEATQLTVRLGDRVVVSDDGDGLPFEVPTEHGPLATAFLTRLHHAASADQHRPHVHVQGLHGVGLAAVNALAARLEVTSWRSGTRWEQGFSRGVPDGPAAGAPDDGRGTTVVLQPDPKIFGDQQPRRSVVRARLFLAAHLFPGLRITLDDEVFLAPEGLGALAPLLFHPTDRWGSRHDRVWSFTHSSSDLHLAVAAIGTAETPTWRTWFAGAKTPEHGSHRDGVARALEDVGWIPGLVLVHAVSTDFRFAGPTRDKVIAPDLVDRFAALLRPSLRAFMDD
jgi:DNA gyrase subunit B